MSTQEKPRLEWGASAYVPDEAPAAWGARLIYPDDLVWDRQGMWGQPEYREPLTEWLNGTNTLAGIGTLRLALNKARELHDNCAVRSNSNAMVVLHDDEVGRIVGNPNSSYGYLYVAGWMRGNWWNEEVIPGFPDTASLTAQAKEIIGLLTETQIIGLSRLGEGRCFDNKRDRNHNIKGHAALEKLGLVQSDWFHTRSGWARESRKEISCKPTLLGRFTQKMLDRSLIHG